MLAWCHCVTLLAVLSRLSVAGTSDDLTSSDCLSGYSNTKCKDLLPGQYSCKEPEISLETQSSVGCNQSDHTVSAACYPVNGTECNQCRFNGTEIGFYSAPEHCFYVTGKYDFNVALCLSVFLGFLGVDRFYLGYAAIGLLKLSTFGFFLLGSLIDIVLIASQVVGPADGSDYYIPYYGPRLIHLTENKDTYYKPVD